MMYIRYFFLALGSVITTLLVMLFAPIIALFIRTDGTLPYLLAWCSTVDSLAIGDETWHQREMVGVTSLYKLCLYWLWRNPAQGYDAWAGLTVEYPYIYSESGNTMANINRDANGWVNGVEGTYKRFLIMGKKDYFEYCKVWCSGTHWYRIQFGWHLHTIAVGETRRLTLTFNRW